MLSKRFIAQSLFEDKWLDGCEEKVIDRPSGGTGDSCIVSRITVISNNRKFTFISKRVSGPSERHGGFDALKSEIKRLSYKVEGEVLQVLKNLKLDSIAEALFWLDETANTSVLIEEDLVAKGFPLHFAELNQLQLLKSIDWLVQFHNSHYHSRAKTSTTRVWTRGGYWSLDKRSDELRKTQHRWEQATELDELPSNFAKRLQMCSRALDSLLFPRFPKLPFDDEEEQRMYGDREEQGEDETARREHIRRALSSKVSQQMLNTLDWTPPTTAASATASRFMRPTLIHGDYKGENLFFTKDNNRCAVCDFQWAGFGLGVLDIVSLLFSSLPPYLATDSFVSKILDRYAGVDCPKRDRVVLRFLFDFAVVDYARYVVGTGLLFQEDLFLLQYANQVLNRLDRGTVLQASFMYNDELQRLQQKL